MKFQITIPGYEYNSNGADYYPDAYEEFEGTVQELVSYIETEETKYRTNRELWLRNPFGRKHATIAALSREVWSKLEAIDPAPCPEWCRGVVEIREVKKLDLQVLLNKAQLTAQRTAERLILKAAADVEAEKSIAAHNREAEERAEFLRLSEKFAAQAHRGCGHRCFEIGGPFIAEDPSCPTHGSLR